MEGHYWPWWKDATGLDAPSNGTSTDTNPARMIPNVVQAPRGAAVNCRLRSASRGYSYLTWIVNYAGYLNNSNASSASRGLPACVIY